VASPRGKLGRAVSLRTRAGFATITRSQVCLIRFPGNLVSHRLKHAFLHHINPSFDKLWGLTLGKQQLGYVLFPLLRGLFRLRCLQGPYAEWSVITIIHISIYCVASSKIARSAPLDIIQACGSGHCLQGTHVFPDCHSS
jgi:hypothetical protein